jgi:hypothetical protein
MDSCSPRRLARCDSRRGPASPGHHPRTALGHGDHVSRLGGQVRTYGDRGERRRPSPRCFVEALQWARPRSPRVGGSTGTESMASPSRIRDAVPDTEPLATHTRANERVTAAGTSGRLPTRQDCRPRGAGWRRKKPTGPDAVTHSGDGHLFASDVPQAHVNNTSDNSEIL